MSPETPQPMLKIFKRLRLGPADPSNMLLGFEAAARFGLECYQFGMK